MVQARRNGSKADNASAPAGKVPGTQALRKGLDVLNVVAESGAPLRFKELLAMTDLPNATLDRLLRTLSEYRLIHYEEIGQTYRLGARSFEMAHQVWENFDLRKGAAPELDRLFEMLDESVRLGVLEDNNVLVVDSREAAQALRVSVGMGLRLPLHASALGKAILAYLSPEQLKVTLEGLDFHQLTDATIVDQQSLIKELALAKARGYAISIGERAIGVNSIAVAILNHRLEPIGGIGFSAPSCRFPEEKLHVVAGDIMKASRRISGNIGEVAMSIAADPKPRLIRYPELRCISNAKPLLGEGPVWMPKEKKILWVDMLGPALHQTDVATGEISSVQLDEITSVVVCQKAGGYVCATESGIYSLDLDSRSKTLLASPEKGIAGNRFNDGKCDANGRFWAGTMAIDASPEKGSLYCLDTDHSVRVVEGGIQVSNGLGWSPDNKTFYFTDSGKRTIFAYDFDLERGEVSNKRVFVEIVDGVARPDGLAVDIDGCVWSAHWDGWRVVRYTPDGTIDRVVELPVPKPTSCAFGGDDNKTLFITSARIRLSAIQIEEAPLSGGLFALQTGVEGVPVSDFGAEGR